MEKILILFVVFGLIGLFLILPTLLLKLKAKKIGAEITFKEVFFMKTRKTLDIDLIHSIALVQKHDLSISTALLEAHKLAGGNPLKSIKGLIYAKEKNIEVDFQQISTAILINKDVCEIIDYTKKIFIIEINQKEIRNPNLKKMEFNYLGEFSMTFARACFNRPEKEKITKEITDRITKYIELSETIDLLKSSKIITETILDTSYWETKGLNLKRQELSIK